MAYTDRDGLMPTSKKPRFLSIRASPWFIVTGVSFACFTDTFLYGLLVAVFPFALEHRAGVNPDHVQIWNSVLLGVYGGGTMIGSPFFGWLADKTNSRRTPMLGGLLLFIISTSLIWHGNHIAMFVVGRVLQGFATAIVWSVGMALVIDTVPIGEVGRYLGFANLGLSVGLFSGPMAGGLIYQHGGWNAVFYCATALLCVDVIFRLAMIETKDALAYRETDEAHCHDPSRPLLQPAYDASSIKSVSQSPAIFRLLKSPRLVCAIVCTMAEAMVETGIDATLPLHLHETFGFDAGTIGLIFGTLVGPSFLSPVVGHLSDLYGPRDLAITGILLTGIAGFATTFTVERTPIQITALIVLLTIIGFAIALVMTPLMIDISLSVEEIETEEPGAFGAGGAYAQAYGLYNFGYASGMLMGPIALGLIREHLGWTATSSSIGIFCLVGSIPAYLFLGSKSSAAVRQSFD